MIYHKGLAEALGITQTQLEDMTMREMVEKAYQLGGTLDIKVGEGEGAGLTLSSEWCGYCKGGTDENVNHCPVCN